MSWQLMWGLAFLIFCVCKFVTWWDVGKPISGRVFGYLFAWPGLDVRTFLNSRMIPSPPRWTEWVFAFLKFLLGLLIYYRVARLLSDPILVGWCGMIGIVFILHFGIFHILSCVWRSCGIVAEPLMKCPIAATSLSDFWGKRWNTAFRNLTHRFMFMPVFRRTRNAEFALCSSFVFSGIVHDIVISAPAGAGYGKPTLFFILQAFGILLENRWRFRTWNGRIFTAFFLVLPVSFLFHKPFIDNVVIPFMKATGAI